VIRQPELLLSKVDEDENKSYCPALFVQSGLRVNSKWDDAFIFFSPHSRKPDDSTSFSLFG
jgi:hypothetical protein